MSPASGGRSRRLWLSAPSRAGTGVQSPLIDELLGLWGRQAARTGRERERPASPIEGEWECRSGRKRPAPANLPASGDVGGCAAHAHKDCTVNADGRAYSMPFALEGRTVEVRLRAGMV